MKSDIVVISGQWSLFWYREMLQVLTGQLYYKFVYAKYGWQASVVRRLNNLYPPDTSQSSG